MTTVLIPLPGYGFDPTESAVPWKKLVDAGHAVVFATPAGKKACADLCMVTGEKLPRLLRKTLMAEPEAVAFYREMEASRAFLNPISYSDAQAESFGALLLPGGHDKGMREYLESPGLQKLVARFFALGKPVAAICHGTLLAARTRSEANGKSVLFGRKTTGLTRNQEWVAYFLTRPWMGDYYRTYEVYMADELVSRLASPSDYARGPGWPIPLGRDSDRNPRPGFTVRDGNYLSARWPGDAYRFARELVEMLRET
jgi:putative intracellular protease/amidase